MVIEISLEEWYKKHPRASKWYPSWYVDFVIEGSKDKNLDCRYSWTSCMTLIRERDNYKCRLCGGKGIKKTEYGHRLEVHHIIPKSQGGVDHPLNLITLCNICHPKTFKNAYQGLPGITFTEILKRKFKFHEENAKLEEYIS